MTDDELDHALLYYSDREAWQAAENAKLEYVAEADDLDEIAAVMQEDAVGANHGRASTQLFYESRPDRDGFAAPPSRRSLNTETREAVALVTREVGYRTIQGGQLAASGMTTDNMPGSVPVLTDKEWGALDPEALRTATLQRLGITPEDWETAIRPGFNQYPEVRAVRARVDEALLSWAEGRGKRTIILSRALGMDRGSIRRRLSNARKRRAEATIAAAA